MSMTWAQAIFPVTAAKTKNFPGGGASKNTLEKHKKEISKELTRKLTKNSPQEAKFHRQMREWHKKQAAMHKSHKSGSDMEMHKANYSLHKECAMYHNGKYKACMK